MKNTNKNKLTHFRQGDVLIEQIPALPQNLKPVSRENGRVILAHGEVTGHAHAITAKHVYQFSETGAAGDLTFLEIKNAMAALDHDEHSTIELPAGNYRVTRQREYSPEEIRRVAD